MTNWLQLIQSHAKMEIPDYGKFMKRNSILEYYQAQMTMAVRLCNMDTDLWINYAKKELSKEGERKWDRCREEMTGKLNFSNKNWRKCVQNHKMWKEKEEALCSFMQTTEVTETRRDYGPGIFLSMSSCYGKSRFKVSVW